MQLIIVKNNNNNKKTDLGLISCFGGRLRARQCPVEGSEGGDEAGATKWLPAAGGSVWEGFREARSEELH